jgi:glycosyltransferase involved in cell wall biosynthesis
MKNKKIVYIIGSYPLLTTTFIDREIMRLDQSGIDLQIFSIRHPNKATPLSSFQYQLQQRVIYLLPINIWRLFASHFYFAFSRPKKFFGTLAYLLTRPHPNLTARIKTILHFGEGVYFAYFLRNQNIFEIHAHFLDRATVLALVAKRLLEIPYSISIHAGADIYVSPVLIREKLIEARHAVTCTQYNKKHLESLIGRDASQKITFVPHGLDASSYISENGNHGKQTILAVGQLKMRKGFLQLIEVCKMLNDRGYDIRCEIIGEGPLRETLEQKISDFSLEDKVILCGAQPHEEVLKRYRRATLFVMPCIQTEDGDVDGIPNVLLEAMAMRIPVISTKISAIPELIRDQKNGILVSPNNQEELFDAITHLLESPEKRAELGEIGRQTVLSDFDIEKNIDKFVKTLWPEL